LDCQRRDLNRPAGAGKEALDAFDAGPWGKKYPSIAQSWRRNWEQIIPFFAFPVAVRRIIYTTNAIESLNAKLRRAVRTRGHFPTDDAAMKLLYLVLRQVAGEWKMPSREWCEAKTQIAIKAPVQWVVSPGGSPGVRATTRSAASPPSGLIREGRVLSRSRPSKPCSKTADGTSDALSH
jgi:hypothetical protein